MPPRSTKKLHRSRGEDFSAEKVALVGDNASPVKKKSAPVTAPAPLCSLTAYLCSAKKAVAEYGLRDS